MFEHWEFEPAPSAASTDGACAPGPSESSKATPPPPVEESADNWADNWPGDWPAEETGDGQTTQ